MNINEDHIIDYLEGSLPAKDLQTFEEQLSTDVKLKAAVEAQRLVNQSLLYHEDQELKAKFAIWKQEEQQTKQENNNRPIKMYSKWLTLAASLLVVAVAGFLLFTPTTSDTLLADYYSEPQPVISRDIQQAGLSNHYTKAVKYYAEGDYNRARENFKSIKRDDSNFQNAQLLIIDCLIKSKEWNAALAATNLDQYQTVKNETFQQRLGWTRALLLLQTNQSAAAKMILDDIATNTQHLFHSKSKMLLNEL